MPRKKLKNRRIWTITERLRHDLEESLEMTNDGDDNYSKHDWMKFCVHRREQEKVVFVSRNKKIKKIGIQWFIIRAGISEIMYYT